MTWSFTMRRGLRSVLVLQCGLAGLMLLTELDARHMMPGGTGDPGTADPVSPGDQVRTFTPGRRETLDFTRPPSFTLPEKVRDGLQFSEITDAELGRLVLMHGSIERGDAARARGYLASLGGDIPPIALHSPGGLVMEAIEIGQHVRSLGLNTVIPSGAHCLSSCPYILAGGVERTVSLGGAVGLHQHYYETPGYMPAFLAVEDIQMGQGETMEHLIAMGIAAEIMLHSLRTRPEDIYVLVEEELLRSGLATQVIP